MKGLLISLSFLTLALNVFAQELEDSPRDGAYDEITIEQSQIIEYDHIREADVFWKRRVWRTIDVREKLNLPFAYPKEYLIDIIRDHAIEGEITLYDPISDDFTKPFTPAEVAELGVGKPDTLRIINPITFEEEVQITTPEFKPANVKKYRIKEDWIFDEETSMLLVRIIGIAPVEEVLDPVTGNYRGDKVLFWAYYPELRPILARYQYFMEGNSASRLSWEDIMEMRFFSSYIYKEENVYDRSIPAYAQGVDALLESDRIKNEIFEFEHDLWSY